MLKKAGIAVAIATAGLLALSPVAFADDTDQKSTEGEGKGNGQNFGSGKSIQECDDGNNSCNSQSTIIDHSEN